jgi:hypothetical protein
MIPIHSTQIKATRYEAEDETAKEKTIMEEASEEECVETKIAGLTLSISMQNETLITAPINSKLL